MLREGERLKKPVLKTPASPETSPKESYTFRNHLSEVSQSIEA